ncbi:MAG: hemophore-related protein [Paludibaculum sp.]
MGVFAAVAAIGVATGSAVLGPSAGADPASPSPSPTPSHSASESSTSSTSASPTTSASASPTSSASESPTSSATSATSATSASESPAASPAAAAGDCTAANLAKTSASVDTALADYLTKHPDTNAALIDFTRQPAFTAVGQMDGYFKDHPAEADAIRGIQAPLNEFKDRCGLQVSPTDALAALASL